MRAKPSSMEIPRSRSSGRRSVSTPVSARDSDRLAVIDVARRAEGEGGTGHAGARSAACTPRTTNPTSTSDSVRGSSSTASSCTRATIGGSPAAQPRAAVPERHRAGFHRDDRALELEQRQRAAARASRRPHDPHGAARRRIRGDAGADPHRTLEQLLLAGGEHLQDRHVRGRAARIAVQAQRRLERRERELVDPHRARQRMSSHALDSRGRADDDAGLRPAEQLVGREAHDVGAGGDAVRAPPARRASSAPSRAGHARQDSRARVVDHREPRGARPARTAHASDASSVNPTVRKLEGCTRISAAVSGPIARS